MLRRLASVVDTLVLLLRRPTPQSFKSRGNVNLIVLACAILWHTLQHEDRWPIELVEVRMHAESGPGGCEGYFGACAAHYPLSHN
jgi:hypothetical protein